MNLAKATQLYHQNWADAVGCQYGLLPTEFRQRGLCWYTHASHMITQLIPLPWTASIFNPDESLPVFFLLVLPQPLVSRFQNYFLHDMQLLETLVSSELNETPITVWFIMLAVPDCSNIVFTSISRQPAEEITQYLLFTYWCIRSTSSNSGIW